jgi:phospholipid transport system substrate-binding protein
MKKWLICLCLLSHFAFAATPEPEPASETKNPTPAQQLQMGVHHLRHFMQQEPPPGPRQIAQFLDTEIAPFFDFAHMTRAATGRFYHRLDPEQRWQMTQEIKQLFLTRLAQGLTGYQNQTVRFLPARIAPDGQEAMVGLYLLNPGVFPSKIDFRLAHSNQGWRVVDVAANGQSAVIYYRQMLTQRFMQQAKKSPAKPGNNGGCPIQSEASKYPASCWTSGFSG